MLINRKAVKLYARSAREQDERFARYGDLRVSNGCVQEIDRHVADVIEAAVKLVGSKKTIRSQHVKEAIRRM